MAPTWQDARPLTDLQAAYVDHLLTVETDRLAREVLITLKRNGIPPRSEWNDFMAQYALSGWDAESDAAAWATLATIANSDWDETFAYADVDHVEAVAQDLGDNAIEGLIVIDAKTGDTLFDRTGVVRDDGSQYVGMQDTKADALLAAVKFGLRLQQLLQTETRLVSEHYPSFGDNRRLGLPPRRLQALLVCPLRRVANGHTMRLAHPVVRPPIPECISTSHDSQTPLDIRVTGALA